jgi:hypothetical protein
VSEAEQDDMKRILKSVEYDILLEWVRGVMKPILLESKLLEIQKSKKKGWFGWGANQGELTSEEDI